MSTMPVMYLDKEICCGAGHWVVGQSKCYSLFQGSTMLYPYNVKQKGVLTKTQILLLLKKNTFWSWFGWELSGSQEIMFGGEKMRKQIFFSWHLLRLPTARSSRLDTALRRSILQRRSIYTKYNYFWEMWKFPDEVKEENPMCCSQQGWSQSSFAMRNEK